MSRCQVEYCMTTTDGSAFGTSRAAVVCKTHGMQDWAVAYAADCLCPIGKIEEATEAALQKISAAQMRDFIDRATDKTMENLNALTEGKQ